MKTFNDIGMMSIVGEVSGPAEIITFKEVNFRNRGMALTVVRAMNEDVTAAMRIKE